MSRMYYSTWALRQFSTLEEISLVPMHATNKAFEQYYQIELEDFGSLCQKSKAPRASARGIHIALKTISSPLSKIPLEFSGDGGGLISPRLIKVGVMPLFSPSPNPLLSEA